MVDSFIKKKKKAGGQTTNLSLFFFLPAFKVFFFNLKNINVLFSIFL